MKIVILQKNVSVVISHVFKINYEYYNQRKDVFLLIRKSETKKLIWKEVFLIIFMIRSK